ncbi:hypothetical protein [Dyadobacter luticola]|uniref:DUF2157 domain-containing protein n=1 Tax=Dyadobacter luticola TaxID=1979387 RepID=A0A5R9L256_9BACT|nr:hypothetical protein [Dyadobacter luticola]TLV02613.1 hypothetical protein FEN17_03040 [Dyadobacter luticola]
MRKAYNITWIENLHIVQTAAKWKSKNLLTSEQEALVKTKFPEHFYRPGLFVKSGLFIFGLIGCSFFAGFLSIFVADMASENTFSVVSLIAAVAYFFFLEHLIKNNKLYHSGIDNALLYAGIGAAMTPVFLLFEGAGFAVYCMLALIILTVATLRYADLLTTLGCFLALFALVGDLMMKFPIGKALLPFALMILSAIVFSQVRLIRNIYYQECKMLLQGLCMVVFYLGGNYFIVREGNAMLNELHLPISPQIDFAPLFYLFTTAIPIGYIFFGLKKHDRLFLIIGLFCFGFSIYTYRHYFSPLTPAQELLVAGALLITIAASAIKYLHTPKFGLSDEQDGRRKLANLEAILVAQNLGQTPAEKGFEFGGGNFGGGGAGEVY